MKKLTAAEVVAMIQKQLEQYEKEREQLYKDDYYFELDLETKVDLYGVALENVLQSNTLEEAKQIAQKALKGINNNDDGT